MGNGVRNRAEFSRNYPLTSIYKNILNNEMGDKRMKHLTCYMVQ